MKLIVTPKNIVNLQALNDIGVKDFIVSLDMLAVKNTSSLSINNFKKIVDYCTQHDCNVYLSLNKMLHNKDLSLLDEVLNQIVGLSFSGIIYSDYAVYTTALEKGIMVPLFYDGDMIATNSFTTSFLNKDLVFLSKELHFEEIEVVANTLKTDVCVQVQGLIGMFHSIRPLVSNYKDYLKADFNAKSLQNRLYDEERDLFYPIIENENGSFIMGGKEIALIDQLDLLDEINVTHLKIDGFLQTEEYILEVSRLYLDALEKYQTDKGGYKEQKKDYMERLTLVGSRPMDKGFFFKPTLYKVKK